MFYLQISEVQVSIALIAYTNKKIDRYTTASH